MKGKKYYKLFLTLVFIYAGSICVSAQTKAQLQKEKDDLAKKIEYTKSLINKAKDNEKNTTTQLQLLDKQILFRKQLIGSINSEVDQIASEIEKKNDEITEKEEYIVALKEEYKAMIYQAYKNRASYDKVMYVFAADNFEQAYKRLKTMQSYTESRQNQTQEIIEVQEELKLQISDLEEIKNEKEKLLQDKESENQNLLKDKKAKSNFLTEVQQEQNKLEKEYKKQIADREKVNKAIRAMIENDMKSKGTKLTPEGQIVSSNFEKNKGTLPWPVSQGIIIQGFGDIKKGALVFPSNGVDIATEPDSKVKSIFDGTVTSVFDIPGAGRNIIVTHGAYKTLYSNLKEVYVKKGDQVSARDEIGKVLTIDGENIVHFEVWKVTSAGTNPINPQSWISKL